MQEAQWHLPWPFATCASDEARAQSPGSKNTTPLAPLWPRAVEQQSVEVRHEVRLDVVKRDRLRAAALQAQLEPPRLVVVLVPVRTRSVGLSFRGGAPTQVVCGRKGVVPLAAGRVSSVVGDHAIHFEAVGHVHILSEHALVRPTLFVFEVCYQQVQRGAVKRVASTARVEQLPVGDLEPPTEEHGLDACKAGCRSLGGMDRWRWVVEASRSGRQW